MGSKLYFLGRISLKPDMSNEGVDFIEVSGECGCCTSESRSVRTAAKRWKKCCHDKENRIQEYEW